MAETGTANSGQNIQLTNILLLFQIVTIMAQLLFIFPDDPYKPGSVSLVMGIDISDYSKFTVVMATPSI
jgi:hypothetical protein